MPVKCTREFTNQKKYQKVFYCAICEIDLTARIPGIKDHYDDIMESALMECVQVCMQELEETGAIAELTEDDFADFEVWIVRSFNAQITRDDLSKCYENAKFLMNCGEYDVAQSVMTFYLYYWWIIFI